MLILIGKMAARAETALCKRNCNVIYIRQIRVKHLELTLGYMGTSFNNGSMTMAFHILKVQEELGGCAKDEMCTSSRNREIRRNIWK